MFILGDFGVRTVGWESTIIQKPAKLAYGSIISQGLPFYGANITYQTNFELKQDCSIAIRTEYYKGTLLRIKVDGEDLGVVAFSPYKVFKDHMKAGVHRLEITLFSSRINCFNALHNCSSTNWIGPNYWYSNGVDWSYEYVLRDIGLMKAPVLEIYSEA